jgi:dTDP-4-dehydrorhamnose reductase
MKLAVLGATGQLGAALMVAAAQRGVAAVPVPRTVDVTDAAAVDAALEGIGATVVVNAAAFHVVPECEREPERAFAVNAIAVMRLARSCAARGVGLITYSTDYVFDGRKGAPYVEDDAPAPLQAYGVSKWAGEQLCRLGHPGALVVRSCGVYGGAGGSRSKGGNFVLNILRQARGRDELEVSSDQTVNPTYAPDLALATLELLGRGAPGGIYHLANAGHCTWAEFAAVAVRGAGLATRIVPVDRGGHSGAARRPAFSALAGPRAAALGVALPGWRDGLERYLAFLAAAGPDPPPGPGAPA